MTLNEMLDEAKRRNSVDLDKDIARLLKVSKQSIAKYRAGTATPGPETAERLADLLAIPLEKVSAAAYAERATNEKTKSRWIKAAAAALLVTLSGMSPVQNINKISDVCILCQMLRRRAKLAHNLL